MKRSFKKQDVMKQTVFSNTHEPSFNPNKLTHYYAFALIEGKEVVLDYFGKFRNEALAALDEDARISGGKLVSGVHVFK